MKGFGTKQVQPTDADRVAAARLSAVAARFKGESSFDFSEVSTDPLADAEGGEEPQSSEIPQEPGDDE